MLFESMWDGRALVPVVVTVAVCGMLDYEAPFPGWDRSLSAVGLGVVVVAAWSGEAASMHLRSDWVGWVQLALALHMLLVGNVTEGKEWRWACAVGLCVMVGLSPEQRLRRDAPWLLLVAPCLCVREKVLISKCIVPIIEALCQVGQFPLQARAPPLRVGKKGRDTCAQDPKKATARLAMVQQQQQETLFYLVAWSVTLGLWSMHQPMVLFWALLLGGLFSLRTDFQKPKEEAAIRLGGAVPAGLTWP